MTYFISPFAEEIANALDGWQWIGISGKTPILVTSFADVFLSDAQGIWFLDTLEGKLIQVASSREELLTLLGSQEKEDHYLLAGFVDRAVREGNRLDAGECYDFKLHPVVGGAISYENVEKCSFLVALHLRGQLHEQVRNFAPGTRISSFSLKGPDL